MTSRFTKPMTGYCVLAVIGIFLSLSLSAWTGRIRPLLDVQPPEQVVKLIFIHHSTGENWLRDDYGGLGKALAENNYFVSDTNYGWGPEGIGDRTDIPDWLEWFASSNTERYLQALFTESEPHSDYSRPWDDPGGENQVILFKSCFPNSQLSGRPDDPPQAGTDLSVANAKYVYNEILKTFAAHPDKLFVVVTAPPVSDRKLAANARAFNQWLVYDWLRENDYTTGNVAVFDFYNVLTGSGAHHRFTDSGIEHILGKQNTLYYPSGDDHPSQKGSRKATQEFVPLLNYFYHQWSAGILDQGMEAISPSDIQVEAQDEPAFSLPCGSAAILLGIGFRFWCKRKPNP
jgi:hypothetical protein